MRLVAPPELLRCLCQLHSKIRPPELTVSFAAHHDASAFQVCDLKGFLPPSQKCQSEGEPALIKMRRWGGTSPSPKKVKQKNPCQCEGVASASDAVTQTLLKPTFGVSAGLSAEGPKVGHQGSGFRVQGQRGVRLCALCHNGGLQCAGNTPTRPPIQHITPAPPSRTSTNPMRASYVRVMGPCLKMAYSSSPSPAIRLCVCVCPCACVI